MAADTSSYQERASVFVKLEIHQLRGWAGGEREAVREQAVQQTLQTKLEGELGHKNGPRGCDW